MRRYGGLNALAHGLVHEVAEAQGGRTHAGTLIRLLCDVEAFGGIMTADMAPWRVLPRTDADTDCMACIAASGGS